ncbi:hypothetical protein CYMTET_39373 [Cymbomonas tetramitiformis]|uniref:C-methyltransferase n=1 Tax=Cymbomonas tetramitiformis TaxID=36881 RepID=A0AAE0CBW4_9CHLO|nr:hypothetical protein CYMTET_39373 [Cymbomonas tetramitiformis]
MLRTGEQERYANYGTLECNIASNRMPAHHVRTKCRLCSSTDLLPVLSLTSTPPANAFVPPELVKHTETAYPLTVSFCQSCTHAQLVDVICAEALFSHYVYVSGTSSVMVSHLREYAEEALKYAEKVPSVRSCPLFVCEFGSNDGTLLKVFQEFGCNVLGVDPAQNLSQRANEQGIPTWCGFFNSEMAERIKTEHGVADLICANHVCAHIDDFEEVLKGIKILLSTTGIWIFEVGYLLDVYTKNLFDTIYHEHLDFHTVLPIRRILPEYGLRLYMARRVNIQGGALRCYVQHDDSSPLPRENLAQLAEMERLEAAAGLHNSITFFQWEARISQLGLELLSLLTGLQNAGKKIVGYGAPAKATTLLYHFGITEKILSFIVDDNPLKQGLYTPGLHIPVLPVERIYDPNVAYVLILAWNFSDSILSKHQRFTEAGGRFIVPLPNLKII